MEIGQIVRHGVGFQRITGGRHPFKPTWMNDVVTVDNGNPSASSHFKATISRSTGSGIPGRFKNADAGIGVRDPTRNLDAIVARSIIQQQNFDMPDRLSQHRPERHGKVVRTIVIRHDDGNQRRFGKVFQISTFGYRFDSKDRLSQPNSHRPAHIRGLSAGTRRSKPSSFAERISAV
nr:hypothetical protein [Jannaschia helgolandensis]